VAALGAAAVQALLEESDLGLKIVDTLLLLLESGVAIGLGLSELFLEFSLAAFGALEPRLVVAGLPAGLGKSALAVGPGARGRRGSRVKGVHPSEYARSAVRTVAR
jgi:hypothetical protein